VWVVRQFTVTVIQPRQFIQDKTNIPRSIDKLFREWKNADAEAQQKALDVVRGTFGNSKYLMIAALKAGIAQYSGDKEWCTVRPPLVELSAEQRASLATELKAIGFQMPGLKAA
jgi:4-hydroxy-tetrahydrodipicolinate synthase